MGKISIVIFVIAALVVGGFFLVRYRAEAGVPAPQNPFERQINAIEDRLDGLEDTEDHQHRDGGYDGSPYLNPMEVRFQPDVLAGDEAYITVTEENFTPYLDISGPLLNVGLPGNRRVRLFDLAEIRDIDELLQIDFGIAPGQFVGTEDTAKITVRDKVSLDIYGARPAILIHPDPPLPPVRAARVINMYESVTVQGSLQVTGLTTSKDLWVTGNLNVGGTKNFVHKHPLDPEKEIVYTSLEGGEAGTYCRGSSRLVGGEAKISLPEHFGLITSQEGITVTITPTSACNGIYVASKSPDCIMVEELLNGRSNATFDYLVLGVRKGYEKKEVIRKTS